LETSHPNCQAIYDLVYKAAEKRWIIPASTKVELDDEGYAVVVHVEVNFPPDD
jgi:hypothetical protein